MSASNSEETPFGHILVVLSGVVCELISPVLTDSLFEPVIKTQIFVNQKTLHSSLSLITVKIQDGDKPRVLLWTAARHASVDCPS